MQNQRNKNYVIIQLPYHYDKKEIIEKLTSDCLKDKDKVLSDKNLPITLESIFPQDVWHMPPTYMGQTLNRYLRRAELSVQKQWALKVYLNNKRNVTVLNGSSALTSISFNIWTNA